MNTKNTISLNTIRELAHDLQISFKVAGFETSRIRNRGDGTIRFETKLVGGMIFKTDGIYHRAFGKTKKLVDYSEGYFKVVDWEQSSLVAEIANSLIEKMGFEIESEKIMNYTTPIELLALARMMSRVKGFRTMQIIGDFGISLSFDHYKLFIKSGYENSFYVIPCIAQEDPDEIGERYTISRNVNLWNRQIKNIMKKCNDRHTAALIDYLDKQAA